MTTPAAPRVAGKRGRLQSEPVALRFLHDYVREPLAPAAYPVDVRGGIADDAWGMLANGPDPACTTHPEGLGDCGYAGRQHYRMAKAAGYGQAEKWETSNELAAEYLKYDHGQDEGVSLPAVLLYWYKKGLIKAFAPVDHTSPAAVDAAMAAFKGVYVGVDLTDDADELFSDGKPWTTANGEKADPDEGHCIVKVYADDPAAKTSPEDGWVSWGAFQKSTKGWTKTCLREAYAIITSEDEAAKVNMPALTADIEALGGHDVKDAADPAPAAPDHEALLAELADLIREVEVSAEKDFSTLTAWLRAREL